MLCAWFPSTRVCYYPVHTLAQTGQYWSVCFCLLARKTSQARLNVHTKSYQLIFFVFPLGMFKRRLPTLLMVSFRAKKMELNLNAAHRQRDPPAKTSLQLCCEIWFSARHETSLCSAATGKQRKHHPQRAAPPVNTRIYGFHKAPVGCDSVIPASSWSESRNHSTYPSLKKHHYVTEALRSNYYCSISNFRTVFFRTRVYIFTSCQLIPPPMFFLWYNSYQNWTKQTLMNDFLINPYWFYNQYTSEDTSVLSAAQWFNVEQKHDEVFFKARKSDFHLGTLIKGLFLWI